MTKKPLNFWFEGGGPAHLYKFRQINDFTRSLIIDQVLYFNSADDFNDPFDFLPIFTMRAPRADLLRYLESTVLNKPRRERRMIAAQIIQDPKYPEYEKQALAIAAAELAKVRRSSGIMCLSSRPDHMLQWGHYADSHKGLALRFRPQKGDGYFESACPVVYQRTRPKLNFVLQDTVSMHRQALLTKADFWSYEEEWRIVKGLGTKGNHKFPVSSLDGIILGAKISEEHERSVRDWAASARLEVEWLRAVLHEDEFGLRIVPG
ncbi:MAG: DUF2971 domain-containing protein [Paracoccus denitrificans]|uniref:DUF2971 domain-containing protein n=1 Tax=Paracoccus denitrificans TaxID=266 RepID=A0A533HZC2_PARDE|nr:MAG: DUF2971 domain-containing protein [Paracoccus denitrificans]